MLQGLIYDISRSQRTYLPLNLSQMSSNTEDSCGLGTFVVCKEDNIVRQVYKQDFKGQQKRGRPLKRWNDQIRNDTGLPLLTTERHAINRTEWMGASSRSTARGQYGLCI